VAVAAAVALDAATGVVQMPLVEEEEEDRVDGSDTYAGNVRGPMASKRVVVAGTRAFLVVGVAIGIPMDGRLGECVASHR